MIDVPGATVPLEGPPSPPGRERPIPRRGSEEREVGGRRTLAHARAGRPRRRRERPGGDTRLPRSAGASRKARPGSSRGTPPVVAVSGPSGSGKTTLLEKLIPALVRRGLAVAALKHSGHPHSFDRPGKDSERLRRAGALAVALFGPHELAYFGPPPEDLAAVLRFLPPCELVLAEGLRKARLPRVLVHRSAVGRLPRAPSAGLLAVVSDVEPSFSAPWFVPGEVEALAEFLVRFARGGTSLTTDVPRAAHRGRTRPRAGRGPAR